MPQKLANALLGVLLALPSAGLSLAPALADSPTATTASLLITNGGPLSCSGAGTAALTCSGDVSGSFVLPVWYTLTNGQDPSDPQTAAFTVTITGEGAPAAEQVNVFSFSAFGQQANSTYESAAYVNGGAVTVTNDATLEFINGFASDISITTSSIDVSSGEVDSNPTKFPTQINTALGGGALMALSMGAPGWGATTTQANYDGGDGGPVSVTNNGDIDVAGSGGSVTYGNTTVPVALNAIGAFSLGGAGTAAKTDNHDYAGTGGDGGDVTVVNTGGIEVTDAIGVAANGIFAFSQGGVGSNREAYALASGGDGGVVSVTNNGAILMSGGDNMVAISALSLGGNSNNYSLFGGVNASPDASPAGNGGNVDVTLNSGSTITVENGSGIGVLAVSAGGNADNVAEGKGGDVTVTVNDGATISNLAGSYYGGSFNIGILAASAGAIGDLAPFQSQNVDTAYPGTPGDVTVNNAGDITTEGSMAVGIAALSVGGATIVTNAADGGTAILGNSADSYGSFDGSGATIVNSGSVTTIGLAAHGLVAQSIGGGGGLLNLEGGTATVNLGSQTSASGAGNGGFVSVTNTGQVTTGNGSGWGDAAIGIVAQSIGGGGGSSGALPQYIGGADAQDSGGGNGGDVLMEAYGNSAILTRDTGALGILAQSVGGGGGNGANAVGVFVAVGGRGGSGGSGGKVTVGVEGAGGITTEGDFAAGIVAQSVGGGGGHGGYADAFGTVLAASIGGAGGNGGDGGTVEVGNASTITTVGNQSWGIVAQSVGGGGGTGGAANTYTLSLITVALAVGGSAGEGGAGGDVTVVNEGTVLTGCDDISNCVFNYAGGPALDGADAVGILAQSIGGGGGTGGAASATSLFVPSGDTIPNLAVSFALGGSGGTGGDAGTVSVTNGGTVKTAGDASYGILAQSIGGGGGNGGDATAATYGIEGAMPSLKISVAIGGSGGVGGGGGTVTVTNGASDDCPDCSPGVIATYGGNATGILAQSIGGGGGTGGAGNASAASPNLGDDTGKSIGVTMGVGGSGGSGNVGGDVTVINGAGSTITTVGTTSQGILAQSIGGGGGSAGGGSASASGDTYDINVAVGGDGGAGNDGGAVTVVNDGAITTGMASYTNDAGLSIATGGDSIGILAQSIGGGGGVAGSSDPSANVSTFGQVQDAINDPSNSYTASIGVGGTGGSGGAGGTVSVTNTGGITTYGVRAFGIEAQSVGGGGGNGGAASSTSNSVLADPEEAGKAGTYSADISIAGNAGPGSDGGLVEVITSGAITTSGYSAHGILAQSIGGGGGVGGEGTVDNTSTVGLGFGISGNSGDGGNGGTIGIEDSGTIVTAGNDAYAILAQSIGGGGGLASTGCSNPELQANIQGVTASRCLGAASVSGSVAPWTDSSTVSVTLGGQAGIAGNGGDVGIEKTDGLILTSGARAMGIVAQSIGGGGGLIAAGDVNVAGVSFSDEQPEGMGGNIGITLGANAAIVTSGDGAFGIFAQSVGGGGGFAGDSSLQVSFMNVNALPLSSGGATSSGGDIAVTIDGDITTTGANAHGLVLQSIGGGGGAVGDGGVLSLGSDHTSGYSTGTGGSIVLEQGAGSTISASGAGSVGILAQSSGNADAQNPINLGIAGTVEGGSGERAAGILLSGGLMPGGADASGAGQTQNQVEIADTGKVLTADGVDGWAILAFTSAVNVNNEGTLIGSVGLYGGDTSETGITSSTLTNFGLFATGATVDVGTATNSGILSPGGSGAIMVTTFGGDLTQTATGTLAVDIDPLSDTETADLIKVDGTAFLDGTITPTASNLLPGSYTIVDAAYLDSDVEVSSSLLFSWDVTATDNLLSISPVADFTPTGTALTSNETALATYLQRTWQSGGAAGMAPVYGALSSLQAGGDYRAALDDLSGENTAFHASDQTLATRDGLDAAFSCPVFVGGDTLLGETSCAWAKAEVSAASEGGAGGAPAYGVNAFSLRFGGQKQVAPDWFIGGNVAYTSSAATGDSILASSDGTRVDASISAKRVQGPWYLGFGANVGYGWYDNERRVALAGRGVNLTSATDVLTVGGRVRAQYEVPFDTWYVRARADLDLIYTHVPSYGEDGPAGLALNVKAQDETTFAFAPYLELGGRLDLSDGWLLRPYAGAGLVAFSNDSWSTEASVKGAPLAAGSFVIETDAPSLLGRFDLGLQLTRAGNFQAQVEYGLRWGEGYTANTGSFRFIYAF